MVRFLSQPHSVTCNRDKSIMLPKIKARSDVFWDLNIMFRYFVCMKKESVNGKVLSFNKYFRTKVNIKGIIRDYSLRNCVANV